MRLFQNAGLYPAYVPRLRKLTAKCSKFADYLDVFLQDRYGACHLLQPVVATDPSAFFTNADDDVLQRAWATEMGLNRDTKLTEILLAQIEEHRTEVFYNLDPMRFGADFVRRLPGCVKKSIAWRAAPSPGADFGAFSLVVCNFPTILDGYRARGWRASYFAPGHDPVMDEYATNMNRPIDVLFVGGFSRHHQRRAVVLQQVAALRHRHTVRFHLDRSRLTRLAESPLGSLLPVGRHRRPQDIRAVSAEPIFGRDLYAAMSQSKIVLNGAVDMAGLDRGNMRCFEALGCGALMVSDHGHYPTGMVEGQTMLCYSDEQPASQVVDRALADSNARELIAANGHGAMQSCYSKALQWQAFQELVGVA
jgi:hypothetical protein